MSNGTWIGALDGDLVGRCKGVCSLGVRWSVPVNFTNVSRIGKVDGILVLIFRMEPGLLIWKYICVEVRSMASVGWLAEGVLLGKLQNVPQLRDVELFLVRDW